MSTLDFSPYKLDLVGVRAGDANRRVIQFLADGVPWDITGAELTAEARATVQDAAPALTATVAILDAVDGLFELSWDGEAIRTLLGDMEKWTGVWDLQVLSQGATLPTTALAGSFGAVMDVTR